MVRSSIAPSLRRTCIRPSSIGIQGASTRRFLDRSRIRLISTGNSSASKKAPLPSSLILPGLVMFGTGIGLGISFLTTPFQPEGSLPSIKYASRQVMLAAARELEAALGEDLVTYDEGDIEAHGFSDWSSINSTGRAVAIVYPRTTEDVSKVASVCHAHRVPIVPYGAGSSIEGNFASPYGGIIIDFSYMDKILAFHPEDMDVVVQPGVNWQTLNKTIAHEDLFLPLDPSPTASIGGMVSTNCSGTNAYRYGTMKDWVVNVTAVLADGRIIKTRRRPRKTSAGYNLTSLFVGAEGTLGIVTEITLKLAVVPKETSVAVVAFNSVADAASAASRVIRSGVQVAAMELMDDVQMRIVRDNGSPAVRRRNWEEKPALFLKFSGPSAEGIAADIRQVRELIQPFKPTRYVFAKDKADEADLWAARKEALWSMTAIKPEGHAIWSTDVAVPISRLAEIITISKEEGAELGVFASIVGHVGDGNFHEALMYDPKDEKQKAAVAAAIHRMMDRALEMEGTVSGEHAIGMGKMQCLMDELGPETLQVMKQFKHAVDPRWILNPGKVFTLPDGSKAVPAPNLITS